MSKLYFIAWSPKKWNAYQTALRKLVFGVSASDPITLLVVAGTLAAVALTACLVPAYRAARLDPLQVLRAE